MTKRCEVCGAHSAKGVVPSSLAPFSFATCEVCLKNLAEPEFVFEFMWDVVGKDVADLVLSRTTWIDGEYIPYSKYVENHK